MINPHFLIGSEDGGEGEEGPKLLTHCPIVRIAQVDSGLAMIVDRSHNVVTFTFRLCLFFLFFFLFPPFFLSVLVFFDLVTAAKMLLTNVKFISSSSCRRRRRV